MKTIPFEKIKFLWDNDWYDGPLSGVGELDGEKVYFFCKDLDEDDCRIFGIYRLSPEEWAKEEERHTAFSELECLPYHKEKYSEYYKKYPPGDNNPKLDEANLICLASDNIDVAVQDWLDKLYLEVAANRTEQAMDILFDNIDDLMLSGRWDECDRALNLIDFSKLNSQLLSGILAATLPGADKLKERPALIERVSKQLYAIEPERAEAILASFR